MSAWAIVLLTLIAVTVAWFVFAGILDAIYSKRQVRAVQVAAPPIPDHRQLKRQQNRRDVEAWDRDYRRLLPPEPPCTSTEHEHIEVYTYGGQVVRRLCGPDSIRL